jgi:hypothetical protein
MNAARLEYTENGVMNMASRRCDIIRISKSSAVLAILTQFNLPRQFYRRAPTDLNDKAREIVSRALHHFVIERYEAWLN